MSPDRQNKMAPETAATAPRAAIVALGKPTGSDNPNAEAQQSPPDNTGKKQAARPSLRTAIDAMCRSCIYDAESGNGTWREQVQQCSSGNCALHPVRPLSVKAQKGNSEAQRNALGGSGPAKAEKAFHGPGLDPNGPTIEQRRAA